MQTLNNENNALNKEELTYAGFFVRMLAYFIDIIIVSIGSFIVKNVLLGGLTQVEFFTKSVLFSYSIVDIFTYVLKVSYFIICIYCTETTLGKYVMKLKVVSKDGSKLTLFNIIYRETIGRFISSFLCVGYFLIFIDKEKTALHDRLCDSRVIYGCNVKKTVFVKPQYAQPPRPPYNVPPQNMGNVPPHNVGNVPPQHMGNVPPHNVGNVPPQNMGNVPPQNSWNEPPHNSKNMPQQSSDNMSSAKQQNIEQ